jgi:predicted nucleic acid-binding Zn ribbon protein
MPIYTFLCSDGHKNDKLVKMDQETVKCPEPGCTKKAKQTIDAGSKNRQSFRFNYIVSD